MYKCEYEGCDNMSKIRTTIKQGEYKGLKVCNYHASILKSPKKISSKTKRTQKARQEQRKDYPKFYQDMIELCKGKKCIETGSIINNPSSVNIVHILAKSTSPEVATNSDNIVFMVWESHNVFDSSLDARRKMKCFSEILKKYKLLKPLLTNITSETLFFDECLTYYFDNYERL